jgi:hypothetical protein
VVERGVGDLELGEDARPRDSGGLRNCGALQRDVNHGSPPGW